MVLHDLNATFKLVKLRSYFYLMALTNRPYVGGVGQRKKPRSTFCVRVKLWLHTDMHIWAHFVRPRGC